MYFERFFERGLAQASYLVGCQKSGEAIVIDPLRDIDTYRTAAERAELTIAYVCETHIHADFLSGARQLAESTGAELLLSEEGGPGWVPTFPHTPLRHGDTIALGNVIVAVIHTPGHTPEHLSFLVTDKATGAEPVMILTGDFLFVGDVGRPDLLETAAGVTGSADEGARRLFASTRTLRSLPDFVQVWPGHGAGSACGKALGALPSTTVGYERRFNWALREESEEAFVREVLTGQPEVPSYFGRMKRINRDGPAPFCLDAEVPELDAQAFHMATQSGARIVDTRSPERFARGHLPGALNLPDDTSFVNWAGWLLDPKQPHLLIAAPQRVEELRRALGRVGVDRVVGFRSDSAGWPAGGTPTEGVTQIAAEELEVKAEELPSALIDVRTRDEYALGHIPGALNIHLGRLATEAGRFDPEQPATVYCEAGSRSAIAASLLLSLGFKKVSNLADGFAAWSAIKGAPVESGKRDGEPR
ncbi:MAG TPA: rhodanese-like domain-containing protein [Spirochaetia bacterium]|nr:rhodanese-like domain-containing protein [Spirochaetia bacterium]